MTSVVYLGIARLDIKYVYVLSEITNQLFTCVWFQKMENLALIFVVFVF